MKKMNTRRRQRPLRDFMLLSFVLHLASLVSFSQTGSGTATILDRRYTSNDLLYADSLHLTMTGVPAPGGGNRYYAWLLEDNDATWLKLGPLTVASGNITFSHAEATNNLIRRYKQMVVSEETDGFPGSAPTTANIRYRAALYAGTGSPGASNALTYIRNAVGTYSTPSSLGLLSWMVRHLIKPDNIVQHAGFAANGSSVADVKTHTDHSFDFANGALSGLVGGNSSIASNGDARGYSFYRYGDLDTAYSSLGGAGYHIARAIAQPDANATMIAEGNNALTALRNLLGADNTTGWLKDFKDRCLQILTTNYGTNLTLARAEATQMRALVLQLQDGTGGAGSNDPATGGILVANRRAQAMATYVLTPVVQPPAAVVLASPTNGATLVPVGPALRWHTVAADTYRVHVATDSMFASIVADHSVAGDTSRTVGPLLNNTKYYWRVRGSNAGGVGPWSAVWNFTTMPAAPSAVNLVSPADGATLQPDSVQFVWNRLGAGIAGHWFEYGTDSTFATSTVDSLLGGADTTKLVKPLTAGQKYWWRVRAKNAAGWGAFSAVRSFTRTTATSVEHVDVPAQFDLSQNYPNPFNPTTSFQLRIADFGSVKVVVYDALGREVVRLVDGEMSPGTHTVHWDAGGMTSGTYFVRMVVPKTGWVKTRAVVLVR